MKGKKKKIQLQISYLYTGDIFDAFQMFTYFSHLNLMKNRNTFVFILRKIVSIKGNVFIKKAYHLAYHPFLSTWVFFEIFLQVKCFYKTETVI